MSWRRLMWRLSVTGAIRRAMRRRFLRDYPQAQGALEELDRIRGETWWKGPPTRGKHVRR